MYCQRKGRELMKTQVKIKLESPLHLGSGRADVNIDADVVYDTYGIPFFPAKRLKGLLYESALEVYEMGKACAAEFFTMDSLEGLFQRRPDTGVELILHNFYLPNYAEMCQSWSYLQKKYCAFISPQDVLAEYTSIRYQTEIDKATGTAKEGSLHNLRVVDAGLEFEGEIEIQLEDGSDQEKLLEYQRILALALQNLSCAGMKRNRGLGQLKCQLDETLKKVLDDVWGDVK